MAFCNECNDRIHPSKLRAGKCPACLQHAPHPGTTIRKKKLESRKAQKRRSKRRSRRDRDDLIQEDVMMDVL